MKTRIIAFSASMIVAVAGGLTLFLANQATPNTVQRSIYYDQPKHPVTREMIREVEAKSAKPAPYFQSKDAEGKPILIGSTSAKSPQFVYFVLDGCPCSVDAEPLIQRLYEHFKHRVDFVAVIGSDAEVAKKWSTQMLMPYPIVPDPKLEIIKAFGAENSVYSALIDQQGRVVKMWPGYSQGILDEMNSQMAALLGEEKRSFDASYAPKEKASGCAFAISATD